MNIVLYTRHTPKCSACIEAKIVLNSQRIPFEEIIIGEDIELKEIFQQFPTAKTVPIVTIDGEYIGGRDELFKRLNILN